MARVKITKTPGAKIKPLYKQDPKTFSLDTGYPILQVEKEGGEFRTQYPEADPEDAVLEAEKGEQLLTPEMENYYIGGKKHSQGGTLIDTDPGSFIFSDDKLLRIKGDILSEFGINPDSKSSKKGFTPAEIAKRYPTNKLLDKIRNQDSDKLDKDTAALGLEGMKKKLARLAFVQESLKGFPEGVPELGSQDDQEPGNNPQMKRGGMVKAQWGGYSNLWNFLNKNKQPEEQIKYQGSYIRKPLSTMKNDPDWRTNWVWDPDMLDWRADPGQLPGRWMQGVTVSTSYKNPRVNQSRKSGVDSLDPVVGNVPTSGSGLSGSNFNTPSGIGNKSQPLNTYGNQNSDTGYGHIDYINMAAPFAVPLKKYPPIRQNINAEQLQFNPLDFEAQRQAIKGQVSQAQEANDVFSGPSSIASSRNAQLFGQSLDPLNQSFMTEFNANQSGRSQIEGQNAQLRQQANLFNAQSDQQYNTQNALTNENYDNEKRLRLQQFLKGLNVAERNRQVRNAGNTINQDFMVTANGQILRKPQSYNPDRQFARITGSSGGGQGYTFDQFKASLPQDVVSSATPLQLWQQYQQSMSATYRGTDVQGISVSSRNPGLIPQPYEYSTLPGR